MIITLRGPARTRHEPRLGRGGRVYPDPRNLENAAAWQDAWERCGAYRIDGPVELQVRVEVERPKTHFLVDGVTLSATGRRYLVPGAPDLDNIAKMACDSLKDRAFGDDSLVAALLLTKAWGPSHQTVIRIDPWPTWARA